MNLWKIILATLVIYAAGVVTGGLLVNHTESGRDRRPHWSAPRPAENRPAENRPPLVPLANASTTNPPREPGNSNRLAFPFGGRSFNREGMDRMNREFLERLDRELKLTADQHKDVAHLMDEGQKHAKEIWDKVAPEMREVMKTTNEKIREVLTPEQKKRFEELMKLKQPKPPKDKDGVLPPLTATNAPAPQP
ncbi:MAG: hypothetical protein RL380_95 [Verrucomicrobiota bacterium]